MNGLTVNLHLLMVPSLITHVVVYDCLLCAAEAEALRFWSHVVSAALLLQTDDDSTQNPPGGQSLSFGPCEEVFLGSQLFKPPPT